MADELDELSFSFLDPAEKDLFLKIIHGLQTDREKQSVCKQIREILPFAKWIRDEYYCGYVGKGLYPHWKKVLTDVFDNAKPGEEVNELIITGGLGTGKSTAACVAAMYKLYTLSCYENLAARFGLIPGSIISEFYFSVSRTQAELTGFGVLKNYIDATPYFNDFFQRNKRLNSMMTFPESVLIVSGSDSSHCVYKGMKIYTSRGIVNAEDLKVNDYVYDGTGFKRVVDVFESLGTGIRVTMNSGRVLELKSNHICLTGRGEVEAKDLVVGDSMNRAVGYTYDSSCLVIDIPKFSKDRNPCLSDKIVLDEDMCELIGAIIGDGCCTKSTHSSNDIRLFGGNDDLSCLEFYRSVASRYFKVPDIKRQNASVIWLSICAKGFRFLLTSLGVEGSCYTKRVPSFIWTSPQSCQVAFLRGLWQTDGSNKGGTHRITSVSKDLVSDVQLLVNSLGINCAVRKPSASRVSSDGYFHRELNMLEIRGLDNNKFSNILGLRNKSWDSLVDTGHGYNYEVQGTVERVISVEPMAEDIFYGCECEDHVYTANGLITHNCIGMNVILSILDEANFRSSNAQSTEGGQNNDKVRTFYASLLQRGKSRFLQNGVNHSLMILVSSNTTQASFTDYRIQQSAGDPHTRVVNCRLWDVKPQGTYSDHGFWVFQGNQTYDAMILESVSDLNTIAESFNCGPYYGDLEYVMNNDVAQIVKDCCVWVPDDFKKQFKDEIYMALQDVAGVSVAPSGRLFNNRQAFNRATRESGLESPFTKDFFILSTGDNVHITDFIKPTWRPGVLAQSQPHHWHFDQSTSNDRTGFAGTYVERWERDAISGQLQPYFVTDFIGCIMPPKPPNQLSIRKSAEILFIARDKMHLPMGKVTYDQFASAGILQDLQAQGFDADRQSVDRTADAYLMWVEAILDGRWRAPYHPIVEAELFNLVLDRTRMRVDHEGVTDNSNPLSGTSKDVCDGIAGSIMNAYQAGIADQEVQYRDMSGENVYYVPTDVDDMYMDILGGHLFSGIDLDAKDWSPYCDLM